MSETILDRFANPRVLNELERRQLGYRLATAEIFYHLPDYPEVLQSFVWQELDLAPRFPVLRRFLKFWERNIEGRLHSVTVASAASPAPREVTLARHEFRLN